MNNNVENDFLGCCLAVRLAGPIEKLCITRTCAAATLAYRSLVVEWLGLRRRCQHGRVGRWSDTVRWPPGARNRRRSPWAAAASVRTTAACENPVTCTVIKRDTRSRRETQRQGVIEVRTVFYSYLHYMYHITTVQVDNSFHYIKHKRKKFSCNLLNLL